MNIIEHVRLPVVLRCRCALFKDFLSYNAVPDIPSKKRRLVAVVGVQIEKLAIG